MSECCTICINVKIFLKFNSLVTDLRCQLFKTNKVFVKKCIYLSFMAFELLLAGLVDFRPDMLKDEKGSVSTVPISIDLVIFPVVLQLKIIKIKI